MTLPVFPSLRITADALVPRGAFAEAQAAFLKPDPELVAELTNLLRSKNAGVVAHFYMDPELQGVLSSCDWPHIHVSDSLAMADRAIAMAEQGVGTVAVLGVDFMSENVRAMLDASGYEHIPVYRVAADPIGCSLAESAEAAAYGAYLTEASKTPRSLHVVYINTSLVTKAKAQALVPTITCTSSNVVQTVLQAAAQVPDVHIWFGPDTYMGDNLANMLASLAEMSNEQIRQVHPAHD
ncbi:MAG: quinolinate synthase NadA, partial [Polyangiales bacterium]